jgi:hypothetical protein
MSTRQVYSRWELAPGEGWHWLLSAQVGHVESTLRDGNDADNNRDAERVEAKGGTGVVLQSIGRHRFLFLSTWDLDDFFSRPWDGGAVQLQMLF